MARGGLSLLATLVVTGSVPVGAQPLPAGPPTPTVVVPATALLRELNLPLFRGRVRLGAQDLEPAPASPAGQELRRDVRAYVALLQLKAIADSVRALDPNEPPPARETVRWDQREAVDAYQRAVGLTQRLEVIATAVLNEAGWRRYFCPEAGAGCNMQVQQLQAWNGTPGTNGHLGGWGTEFNRRDAYRLFMAEALPELLAAAEALPDEVLMVAAWRVPAYEFGGGGFPLHVFTAFADMPYGFVSLRRAEAEAWDAPPGGNRPVLVSVPEAKARGLVNSVDFWLAASVRVGLTSWGLGYSFIAPEVTVYEDGALTRMVGVADLRTAGPRP